ncbi:MAG TPA: tetratricopeptide repeat protein [Rudaea sp.]|nr:tetratricopeptide repeat protein [Rudaea sp.]
MSLFDELKRRNVIRMAGLYLVGAWLVVQVAGTVLPIFHTPDWALQALVVMVAIGFVPALVFAWVFELTPEGLKRDAEVKPGESIAPQTARRMDRTIIVVLIIALVYFGFDKFVLAPRREAAAVASAAQAASAVKVGTAATVAADVNPKSVAVLPFVNMSGDPNNEYFSDGITEEILNALAQIADLKVAARTSAFAFKGKDPDLRKVGEVLAVANVLEGSVQRAGDDVRITAQLIDTRSGFHLWSEKYDRKLTNIFAVEDEISKAIAEKLQLQLGAAHKEIAVGTVNPQAHEQYLRGLTLLAARGRGLKDAAEAFSQAVKLDPQYAQAWGALAEAEMLLPGYVPGDMKEAMRRAEGAAQRALAIDPATGSAHVALGEAHEYRREWPQAEQAFRRALDLAPGDAEAINQYAQFLCTTGQLGPALLQIDHARQLDPLSAIVGLTRAVILMGLHRDDDATAQLQATLAIHPDFVFAHWTAMIHYAQLKRFAEAEAQARAGAKGLDLDPEGLTILIRGLAVPAERVSAVRAIESTIAADNDEPLFSAMFLALLGEHDKALARIEVFVDRPGSVFPGLLWVGALDPLRDDPRYKAALKKMHLPYPPTAGSTP